MIERLPNANRVNDYIFQTITQNGHHSDEKEVEEDDNFDQPPKNRKNQKKSDDYDYDENE